MATTAKKFLEEKHHINNDYNAVLRLKKTGSPYQSLAQMLDDYHQLKMQEKGFKVDNDNREDTLRT